MPRKVLVPHIEAPIVADDHPGIHIYPLEIELPPQIVWEEVRLGREALVWSRRAEAEARHVVRR